MGSLTQAVAAAAAEAAKPKATGDGREGGREGGRERGREGGREERTRGRQNKHGGESWICAGKPTNRHGPANQGVWMDEFHFAPSHHLRNPGF